MKRFVSFLMAVILVLTSFSTWGLERVEAADTVDNLEINLPAILVPGKPLSAYESVGWRSAGYELFEGINEARWEVYSEAKNTFLPCDRQTIIGGKMRYRRLFRFKCQDGWDFPLAADGEYAETTEVYVSTDNYANLTKRSVYNYPKKAQETPYITFYFEWPETESLGGQVTFDANGGYFNNEPDADTLMYSIDEHGMSH